MPIRPDLRHFYTGPEWRATRERIRERAHDCCEQCGRPNGSDAVLTESGEYVDPDACHGTGRAVTIQCGCAHLNHIPSDNRDGNLKWLCRRCHLLHDQGKHKDTRSARKDAARPLLQEAV